MSEQHKTEGGKMKTVSVRQWGGSVSAYYEDGQVWVWDSVAGHYTTCHHLTARQIARVRRMASR